jgi:hypothetical protein
MSSLAALTGIEKFATVRIEDASSIIGQQVI